MIHIETTSRPKRVARDLRAALAAAGHPLTHSKCLELASRMLGHPSYGMLARSVGARGMSPDDHALPPVEAAARRAFQARVLLQAGVPAGIVGAALDAARATSRSAAISRHASGPAWGYVTFDHGFALKDADQAGWLCLHGGAPVRFGSFGDIDPAVTWWSNLAYQPHRILGLQGSPVLGSGFLGPTPATALGETGGPSDGAASMQAVAALAADVLSRAAPLLSGPLRGHPTLVRALAAEWARGGSPVPDVFPMPWEEFAVTGIRMHRNAEWETFRMPRVSYARAMLSTPVPVGSVEEVDLTRIPSTAGRLRWLEGHREAALVLVEPPVRGGRGCPVRSTFHCPGDGPGWMARPYFDLVAEGAAPVPRAAILASGMAPALEAVPHALAGFLDRADEGAWADGIVAEAVWRSGLYRSGASHGSCQASVGAAYLRGVDLSNMCRQALRLGEDGAAVSSYGLGWVRYTRPAPARPGWPPSWGEAAT